MKKYIASLTRFATATALLGSLLLAAPVSTRAEGGGVGGGNLPPPKCVVYVSPDGSYVIYSDGSVCYLK